LLRPCYTVTVIFHSGGRRGCDCMLVWFTTTCACIENTTDPPWDTYKLYHIMLYREHHRPTVRHLQTLSHNVV
jgi:hypothetical protein